MLYSMMPYRSHRLPQRYDQTPSLFDDRFFRSFFDMNDWMGNMGFRVDIHDAEDHYELEAELPGVSEDQINLTVENDALTISADMQSDRKDEKAYYSERRVGHVSRSFSLDGIDQEHITADYKNGILTVTLPKTQPTQAPGARRIAIGHAGTENKDQKA
ncbi:MAG: Hsp20/alpha crystallin family protein [Clostridia bacterium]|nr:Hsp20/alpha crystallin family protein [Clostridia bacterium]